MSRAAEEAERACCYILERVRMQAGRRSLQGMRRPPLPCTAALETVRLFAARRISGVPEAAARALIGWAHGQRRVALCGEAPSARAVLALTARGVRPVSLLDTEDPAAGLAFTLHDLCHLEKFADPAHHLGQVGFFGLLDRQIDGPTWSLLERGLDAPWPAERDHVLADMNGSPLFLFSALRARLVEACRRAGIDPRERLSLLMAILAIPSAWHAWAGTLSLAHHPDAAEMLARHFTEAGRQTIDS